MCRLLETMMVKNGHLQNLYWHNARVNAALHDKFSITGLWDLAKLIPIPALDPGIIYRCRLLYARQIEQVEFIPYTPRMVKKLYLVQVTDLDYAFKYADRTALENLRKSKSPEPDADILIIKNGLVTDTSFSNIVFNDGSGWVTPDSPLLKGTKRAMYLEQGLIRERRITPADLPLYRQARLINALNDLETNNDIDIRNIIA